MKEIMIEPKKTALIVIDIQNGFVAKGGFLELPAARKMLPVLQDLISACRERLIPIIYTRMSHQFMRSTTYPDLWPDHFREDGTPILAPGSGEFELIDELKVETGDIVLDKDRYSAFFGTKLDLILKDLDVDTLLVTGLASNVCCESTVRDAFSIGYRVIFIDDLNVTLNEEMHRSAVENIKLVFGYVMSSNDLLKRIKE